jgi:hypothetical protein
MLLVTAAAALPAQQRALPGTLRLSHSFSPHTGTLPRTAASLPDTVRLLAVMVDFQEDSDDRTSGTGKFGTIYEYDYGTEILDPMPHDRAKFQHHLLFLENYVRKVSGRRTILKGEVLDGTVTMAKPIGEYSFRSGASEAPVAQLAVDAWTAAAQRFPTVRFGDYDMFVVFHAGRGRDVDLVSVQGFDPTPLDIPSLSFTMDSFTRLLGTDFDGIAMPDGSEITNCAIIPTTNNREIPLLDGSVGLLELTINGLLAASFGTWAGLPDLFDTETGKTGIGRFGLMDGEGIFAYGGICPPEPSAWEKQLLGWTIAREAMPGRNNYLLTASDSLTTPDVLRVPINGDEYWLVENRQRDLGGNGQSVTIVSGGQTQTLRFPKDTTGFRNGDVSQLKGVIIDVEDIDWALPGGRVVADDSEARINGGLLIWHIDERVIRENRKTNTVNTGDHVRGVDLEQAGGPQDIGVDIETVFGTETGTGSPLDYWTRDNISPVYANSFGMVTAPNTRANSGAYSHVTMDNFSGSAPIMSLDVALGDNTIAPVAGWPVDVGPLLAPGRTVHLRTADLDGLGDDEILVVFGSDSLLQNATMEVLPDTVRVFAFKQDGSPLRSAGIAPVFSHTPARAVSAPTVGDWNGDGAAEIALVTRMGPEITAPAQLWVLSPGDLDMDGFFDVLGRFDFPGDEHVLLTPPAIVGGSLCFRVGSPLADTLYVIGEDVGRYVIPRSDWPNSLVGFNPLRWRVMAWSASQALLTGDARPLLVDLVNGTLSDVHVAMRSEQLNSPSLGQQTAVTGDFDGDGRVEAMFSGWRDLMLVSAADDADRLPFDLMTSPAGSGQRYLHGSAADVDGDGRLDAVLSSGDAIRAMSFALSTVDHFPARRPVRFALSAAMEPQGAHAVFGVGEDRVWQFVTGAKQADGFPIPIPYRADVALLRSPQGRLSIAAASPAGRLFLFETGTAVTDEQLIWRARDGDAANNFSVLRPFSGSSPFEDFFPEHRCYNWPNPVYEDVTYIRMYVSEDASVSIKIYDLAGDRVDEINATAVGGTDTDIPWDVRDIESDVYLARVQVTAGARSEEKIIKIAVVK